MMYNFVKESTITILGLRVRVKHYGVEDLLHFKYPSLPVYPGPRPPFFAAHNRCPNPKRLASEAWENIDLNYAQFPFRLSLPVASVNSLS